MTAFQEIQTDHGSYMSTGSFSVSHVLMQYKGCVYTLVVSCLIFLSRYMLSLDLASCQSK